MGDPDATVVITSAIDAGPKSQSILEMPSRSTKEVFRWRAMPGCIFLVLAGALFSFFLRFHFSPPLGEMDNLACQNPSRGLVSVGVLMMILLGFSRHRDPISQNQEIAGWLINLCCAGRRSGGGAIGLVRDSCSP